MSTGADDDEHVGSLTGAYALDALDPLEKARVRRHLDACEQCAAEVRSFRETAARLAAGAATAPPAGLRDRVLAQTARTRQLPPQLPAQASRRRRLGGAGARWASAAAVVLLALTVAAGGIAWRAERAADEARLVATAVADALADPAREVIAAELGTGRAALVVAEDEVLVLAGDVPDPGQDRVFQLWFVGADGPRSATLLRRLDDETLWGRAEGLRPGDVLAVTVEPAGGSPAPTSDPVLQAQPLEG